MTKMKYGFDSRKEERCVEKGDMYCAHYNTDLCETDMAIHDHRYLPVKEYTDDPEQAIATGGVKYDGGKAPVFRGALSYFPRALEQVALVSAFGATKYAWKGWQDVPNGFERYSDALVRHLTAEGMGQVTDRDSGLLHEAHTAWNALARLELRLRMEDQNAVH